MRIPDPLPCGLGLVLEFFPLVVFLGGLSLAFLELCPAVFEKVCRQIETPDFCVTDIARDVVVGRQRMDRRECGFFPDSQSAKEFARFKSPGLRKSEVFQV